MGSSIAIQRIPLTRHVVRAVAQNFALAIPTVQSWAVGKHELAE